MVLRVTQNTVTLSQNISYDDQFHDDDAFDEFDDDDDEFDDFDNDDDDNEFKWDQNTATDVLGEVFWCRYYLTTERARPTT